MVVNCPNNNRPLLQKNEAFHGRSTHIPNIAAFQLRFRQISTRSFLNRVSTETQGSCEVVGCTYCCWWKKSGCITTWHVWNPVNNEIILKPYQIWCMIFVHRKYLVQNEFLFCSMMFTGSEIMATCFKDISVYEISRNIAMEIPQFLV